MLFLLVNTLSSNDFMLCWTCSYRCKKRVNLGEVYSKIHAQNGENTGTIHRGNPPKKRGAGFTLHLWSPNERVVKLRIFLLTYENGVPTQLDGFPWWRLRVGSAPGGRSDNHGVNGPSSPYRPDAGKLPDRDRGWCQAEGRRGPWRHDSARRFQRLAFPHPVLA